METTEQYAMRLADDVRVFRENSLWFVVLGIVMIVLGLGAISLPYVTTLGIAVLFGWILIVSGIAQVVNAIKSQKWRGFLFALLLGVFVFAAGVWLLVAPFRGMAALVWFFAVILSIEGLGKIILSFRIRPMRGWSWMLFSGVMSLLLGFLIWSGLPAVSVLMIALLVGANLIVGGAVLIIMSVAARKLMPHSL